MIYGLEAQALPENWIALEATCILKCLDEDGEVVWALRSTQHLSDMECIGMLTVASDQQLATLRDRWEDESDDNDQA